MWKFYKVFPSFSPKLTHRSTQFFHSINKYITFDKLFDTARKTKKITQNRWIFISDLKILQGIPLFQAIAVLWTGTIFPKTLPLMNISNPEMNFFVPLYLWISLFLCISEYVIIEVPFLKSSSVSINMFWMYFICNYDFFLNSYLLLLFYVWIITDR